jgi:hypothetical protein
MSWLLSLLISLLGSPDHHTRVVATEVLTVVNNVLDIRGSLKPYLESQDREIAKRTRSVLDAYYVLPDFGLETPCLFCFGVDMSNELAIQVAECYYGGPCEAMYSVFNEDSTVARDVAAVYCRELFTEGFNRHDVARIMARAHGKEFFFAFE